MTSNTKSVNERAALQDPGQDQPYPAWSDIRRRVTCDLPCAQPLPDSRDWSALLDEPSDPALDSPARRS